MHLSLYGHTVSQFARIKGRHNYNETLSTVLVKVTFKSNALQYCATPLKSN